MDTRDTPEQAELRRSARQLARELGPVTVADLGDATRKKRLAGAVRDAGWLELRDDTPNSAPLASAVEAAIVAEALAAGVADVAFIGPLLAADLARRAGASGAAAVAYAPDLTGPGAMVAIDVAPETPGDAYVVHNSSTLGRAPVEIVEGSDLTRAVAVVTDDSQPIAGSLAPDALVAWSALGLALTSADLVGAMRGATNVTVDYASQRKQFGVPVGSFQAVQHLLAEAHCLLEGSVSIAAYAAWAVDALEPAEALLAGRQAKAYCARAARTVCETAIQVHGGVGNTWECMAHVYLRRALLSSVWFGDDRVQLSALGAAYGLP